MKSGLRQLMLQFGSGKKAALIWLLIGMSCLATIGCVNREATYFNVIPVNKASDLLNQVEEIDMLSFKMIKNASNTVIGYIKETENLVPSAITEGGKERKKIYYVYDADFKQIGFITEHGTVSVYKYSAKGSAIQVAQGEIFTIDAGNRKLLNYDGAIYYDDFEPAPPWRDRYRQ